MNPKTKLVLLGSAAFLIAAVLYGQLSMSSSKPGTPFTADGEVVSRVFEPEHDAVPRPYTKQQLGHAQAWAKVGARYLINVKLDSGEMLTGDCAPQAVDQYPVGQRVRIQGERNAPTLFGKGIIIHSMLPVGASGAR